MIVGLAMGATVNIGQAIGGRDNRRAALFTGNTVTLFMGLSVTLTFLLLILRNAIVSAVFNPRRRRVWHGGLPYNLLYRHTVYNGV